MSASWFLVSMYLFWILGSKLIQIDSIQQPIESNSVGSGNVSHCGTSSLHTHLDNCFVVLKRLKQSDRTYRERESCPISVQRAKKWFRILLKCKKLMFVSYTSNFLEQTCDFQKRMFPPKWILNLQDLLQHRSFETITTCRKKWYPQSNTVCAHMCDECKISIDSDVCHRVWSILRWIVRAYLLTIE